jgi:hypothetical protein
VEERQQQVLLLDAPALELLPALLEPREPQLGAPSLQARLLLSVIVEGYLRQGPHVALHPL